MMTITDRDPGDESEAAMTDERAAVEHKRCPLCGSRPRVENHKRLGLEAWCGGDEDKPCFMRRWPIPLDQWNTRPIEDALRAEIERLLREQAEFTGAALCALGLNRDERVSPGNQVLDEIERLSARVSDLTRMLAEAEEGVRKLYEWAYAQEWETEEEQIVGEVTREMATDAGEPGMVGMPVYGKVKATWVLAETGEPWRSLRDDNEFVQRALQSGEGGESDQS